MQQTYFAKKAMKQILSKVPALIIASFLLVSGVLKISGLHPMQSHFDHIGLGQYVWMFGVIEIIAAVLFMLPFTRKAGLLLLTAYFGGAIATELPHQMIGAPIIVLLLVWIAAYIRDPEY